MSTLDELPASTDSESGPTLLANKLSTRQVLIFGTSISPIAVIFATSGSLLIGAGHSAWVAIIPAAVIAAIVGFIVVHFARKHVVTGSLMSYLRLELGDRSAMLGAAALFIGYLGAVIIFVGSALFTGIAALNQMGLAYPHTPVIIIAGGIMIAVCCLLQRRGVSVSVNAAILLTWVAAPLVAILLVAALIHYGVHIGGQLSFRGFSFSSLIPVVLIVFATYAGFEGLTSLAKETRNPTRAMPVVLGGVLGVLTIATLLATWLTLPMFLNNLKALDAGAAPPNIMATIGHVHWIAAPTDLLLAVAAVGGCLTYLADCSRIVSTAGRDGYLPSVLGRINPKYHTPSTAGMAMGALGFTLYGVFMIFNKQGLYGVLVDFAQLISYSWFVAYIAIVVAGVVSIWRSSRHRGAIAAGVVALAGLGFMLVYQFAHLSGTSGTFALLTVGGIAVVFAATTVMFSRRSDEETSTETTEEAAMGTT